ncbi:MAG TPA: hypothetical protein VIZ68_05505 [Thermoplasmata archaeon]
MGATTLVLLVAGCSLLSAILPVGAAAGPVAPSVGSTRGGTGVPAGPVSCSALVDGSTLTALVSQYYPNGSLLPSESQAEQAVVTTWNDVCGSTEFDQALAAAAGGWFEYTSRMQDKNRTASGGLVGSLFVDFTLTWNASCPSGGSGYVTGYGCQFKDVWQANLTDQSVTGPAVTITSLRFVPCDTPDANGTAVGSVQEFFPSPGTAPNESVAVQEVQVMWGAICTSSTFYGIAASLEMPQALSFSTWRADAGPNATLDPSGHLYFEWSLFTGDRPCPSENGSYANGLTCSYSESWTADLTADTYSGPSLSGYPLGSGAVESPPGAGNLPTTQWIPVVVGVSVVGGAVGVVIWVLRRRRKNRV